jgi:hypothetical protein
MAQTDIDPCLGIPDKRIGRGLNSGSANPLATPANYVSISVLRTALAAAEAGTYTSAYLDKMTKNDMINALRIFSDSAGIK